MYIPKPPKINLADALEKLAPKIPYDPRPGPFSLPRFHSNVYVRMLAAKPKMDVITKRVYPSTLLAKVGLHENKPTVVSQEHPITGPRVYCSSSPTIKKIPPQAFGRIFTKTKTKISKSNIPVFNLHEVILKDINDLKDLYKNSLKVDELACTTKYKVDNVPFFPVDLDLPDEICANLEGLHLAGCIYKYMKIYK